MISSFPLSTIPYDCVALAVSYKLQDLEEQARYKMQSSSIPNDFVKKQIFPIREENITRIEQIVRCVEFLIKCFFECGYNTGIALLVSIPASIHKNSQSTFPRIRKFWKNRLYQAGTSLGMGLAKIVVLTKLVGFIHAVGSIICYFKPSYRPDIQKIDEMSSVDIDCAVTAALLGAVITHIGQKNLIDRISTFVTLALYSAKPAVVEVMSKTYKWISPIAIDRKALESSYDKKCCEIIQHLDKSNNPQEISNDIFNFCKGILIQVMDACDTNASVVAKCVANSIKNIFAENAIVISQYYQKEFSEMKTSLENAKNSEEVILTIKDFSVVFREIFQGLHVAIQYEKNCCIKGIADLLQTNQEEEFVDALDDQDWL